MAKIGMSEKNHWIFEKVHNSLAHCNVHRIVDNAFSRISLHSQAEHFGTGLSPKRKFQKLGKRVMYSLRMHHEALSVNHISIVENVARRISEHCVENNTIDFTVYRKMRIFFDSLKKWILS